MRRVREPRELSALARVAATEVDAYGRAHPWSADQRVPPEAQQREFERQPRPDALQCIGRAPDPDEETSWLSTCID